MSINVNILKSNTLKYKAKINNLIITRFFNFLKLNNLEILYLFNYSMIENN